MDYRVVILSEDEVFARMLELEFSALQVSVLVTVQLNDEDRADVLILDLDSASAPPPAQYRKMIGFSRRSAMNVSDARSCSMILRRPFRMSLLRQEVLTQIAKNDFFASKQMQTRKADKRQILLRREERTLICDGQAVVLSPTELTLMECLLAHRGMAVSRTVLSESIGSDAEGNEIDVYICYLRRKTDQLPEGRLIQTVRGKGYQIS